MWKHSDHISGIVHATMVVPLKIQVVKGQRVSKSVLFFLTGGAAPYSLQVQMGKRQNGRLRVMLLALCFQVQPVVVSPAAPDKVPSQIIQPDVHGLNGSRERRRFVHHLLSNAGKPGTELTQRRMPDWSH